MLSGLRQIGSFSYKHLTQMHTQGKSVWLRDKRCHFEQTESEH